MFKNYLKIALRTLRRHKIYAGINILGLALGIACCLVILLTVQRELSYDRFHPDADRLYRVVQDVSWGSGSTWSWTGGPMGPVLEEDFTEVEASTRLVVESRLVEAEIDGRDTRFQEDRFGFADPSFFELFRFDFISGDPATALADPQAVVLTASMAAKYFGDADPMGRELEVSNSQTLRVTGVIEDVPDNTHLDFDCVGSLQALMQLYGTPDFRESWWWPNTATYVRLSGTAANPTTVDRLNATDLPAFIQRHREPQYATAILPRLQPVTDIHLYDNPGDNAISFVYIFSVIAFFILLIACVNYMNLATARSALRAREVGVRKAIGAVRSQLVQQFYGESICVTLIALLVGLLLAETMLPLFNELLDRNLNLNYADPLLWTGLLGIGLVVGLLAGSYPALV